MSIIQYPELLKIYIQRDKLKNLTHKSKRNSKKYSSNPCMNKKHSELKTNWQHKPNISTITLM